MEPALFLSLLLGVWMLSFSARQCFTQDEHRLRLDEIPFRVRAALRRGAPAGYWVRVLRVTMEGGRPAYWFTGSTPARADVALLLLDSGELAELPAGYSQIIEDNDATPPSPARLRLRRAPSGLAGVEG